MTAWLLTWLWQGVAVAASLSLVLRVLPRVNAATRYLLWWGAFAGLIVLGWQALPSAHLAAGSIPASMPAMSGELWPAIQVQALPASALSAILMVWACVACFRLLRIFPGLHALYRLKDECRPFPAELEAQLTLWREGRGRRVRLALCDRVPGAAVLGFHDPCIAVPPSLLAELRPDELDQIILHEYGHVQRRDDWMRLLQTFVEAAMWPHPALYLIGRALNLEREVACDDWVIARTGSPKNYARCLSRVAGHARVTAAPAFAQALFGGRRHLLSRVDRLLDARRNACRTPSLPAAVFGGLAIAVCAVQLRSFPMFSDVPVASATVKSATMESAAVESGLSRTVIPAVAEKTVRHKADTTYSRSSVRRFRLRADDIAIQADEVPADQGDSSVESVAMTSIGTEPPRVLHPTRVFVGVYDRADNSPPTRTEGKGSLNGLVSAGLGIGEAAQRAGLGLSDAFTRAGTGLARRF